MEKNDFILNDETDYKKIMELYSNIMDDNY